MKPYQRVLLKLSGEALMGPGGCVHDAATIDRLARDVVAVHQQGVGICLVVGGGNIYRGEAAALEGMERSSADYMGMLGTVINALALQHTLERFGVSTRVLSAIPMLTVCEPYIRRRAIRHIEKGRIVIFAGGTGNPFFTTDTAAVLRAVEMGCDALLKGTQVDGVYSADPKKEPTASRYDSLTYRELLANDLRVMDAAAVALARENHLPIIVFSLHREDALAAVLAGRGDYTIIQGEPSTSIEPSTVPTR